MIRLADRPDISSEAKTEGGDGAVRLAMRIAPLDSGWDAFWDELAGAAAESGFMQSSAWAHFKRLEGYQTSRIGLFEDERLIGGASLLQYAGPDSGMILCPEGPVLPWADRDRAVRGIRAFLAETERQAAQSGEIGLRIEPHLDPSQAGLFRNWVRAPIDMTPISSLIVDVTQSDDELLSAMDPKGRYNLRLAQRHGVQVVRSTSTDDIRTFFRLFQETASRGNFFAEPYGFFLNLATALFPSGQSVLYLAEWQGEVLAAILVVYFGRRATYLYGSSGGRNRNVMPNYALHWQAIQDARTRGCREYDLYGYDPFGHPDHLYAGISRFKRHWGGDRRDTIGARDYIFYDQLADRIVELVSGTR